ncbi:MAG: beta-propeller domain-containing protein, partial [Pseudomonadota bacterium]
EDIRSVRFDGDRGFVVTFKKTDPLFVFDLSDPKNPQTLAELKIPGFSTYMHMMDPEHLLTIGYDADDQGSFAWFTGVMLQIFDVSMPTQPKLMHKEVIGTRGSSSEALTNHLAFTFFAPKDLLALPMTVCEGGYGGGGYGDQMTFSGLMVYDATSAAGFKLRGKVPHPVGPDATCSNWWTDASSQVKRSIIMDDYVFSISNDLIKANHLNNLSTDLANISLAD